MRVLILSQAYPPLLGGSEQFAYDLSSQLARRGHQVSVATLPHRGAPALGVSDGVAVYRLPALVHRAARLLFQDPSRSHAPPLPDPELSLALARVCLRERPQVVHAIDWMVHSFVPLRPLTDAKLVVTLQDYCLVCPKKTFVQGQVTCEGASLPRCLSCVGRHYGPLKGTATLLAAAAASTLARRSVDAFVPVSRAVAAVSRLARRYRVIPNFVVPGDRDPSPDEARLLPLLPVEPFLLYVGALSRKKGVDVLLEAYSRLRNAPPLVLIGYTTAEYPVPLDSLPPGVTVIKNLPHHLVMAAWRRALLGLVPSVSPEPFGIVAIEAMDAGLPVIVSRTGGLQDIVEDGRSGLHVPPGDAAALQAAMETLLRDPELRARMGVSARLRVKRFHAGTVVALYEDLYEELLRGTSRERIH